MSDETVLDGISMLEAANNAVLATAGGVAKPPNMLVMGIEERGQLLELLKSGNEYSVPNHYPEKQPAEIGSYKSPFGSYKSPVIEHGDGTAWVKVDVRDSHYSSSEAPAAHLLITVGERAYKLTFSATEFEALAEAVRDGAMRVADEMVERSAYVKARAAAQKRLDDWRNRKAAWAKRITTWWAAVNPKNKKKTDNGAERRIFVEDIPADVDLSLVPDAEIDPIPF